VTTVRILSTGGTIANTVDGRVGVDDVIDAIRRQHPQAFGALGIDVSVVEVLREGGETFTPVEWVTIARSVQQCVDDPEVDGIVVTHGTFTAEETAYFLHLTVNTDKPVVVACSQRKHGTLGNDGGRNLLDALRVAGAPTARGRGVLVVLNEEIHSAREVTKTNQRPGGFRSGSYGILGSVEADQVTFYRTLARRHTSSSELLVPVDGALPRVDIVATYAGADGVAVDALVAAGTQGLVVHGFSFSGKPHHLQRPALEHAVQAGVPVVLTNRGGDGRIPVESSHGFVRGDNLTAQKARVLLTLALTSTTDQATIQRLFDSH
jgi:L-asparaginase